MNEADHIKVFTYKLKALGLMGAWLLLKTEKYDDNDDLILQANDDPRYITLYNFDQEIRKSTEAGDKFFEKQLLKLQ